MKCRCVSVCVKKNKMLPLFVKKNEMLLCVKNKMLLCLFDKKNEILLCVCEEEE